MGNREFFRFVVIGVSLLLGACSADLVELPGFGAGGWSERGAPAVGASPAGAPAGGGYRAYAAALLAVPRNNVKFRPDLETYLDGMAAATRRSSGLRPVAAAARMKEAARAQALDMALGGYVGHTSRNGYAFVKRANAYSDYRTNGRRAENAAMNWRTSGSVDQARAKVLFEQWLNSADHRHNLLTPAFAYVATGAVETGNSLYAVQIFWQNDGSPGAAPDDAAAAVQKSVPAAD
jgi:uncharacterized protein YkwD